MAEESPSPVPIVVNIHNINQSEDLENGNSGELVEPVSIEASGDSVTVSELVSDPSAQAEQTGADGSLQSGNAAGSASTDGNAIEIARIEAERDLTIAAIDAETEQARIAASAAPNQELELWQTRLTTLEAELAEIKNLLTPPPQLEETIVEEIQEPTTEQLETHSEPPSTDQFMPVPTVEIGTALSEVNEDVNQDLAKLKPKFIPI
jgi:hypothetical protein